MPTVVNSDGRAIWWTSGLAIDADGAPKAYAPAGGDLQGLDFLANAGSAGDWYGLVVGPDGQPLVQRATDPCPGYYISTTALVDHSKAVSDPRRYVDSTVTPYVSVPSDAMHTYGLKVGDVAFVHSRTTGRACAAVVADVGPKGKYGEGSICLAKNLGIPSDPRRGGCESGVTVVVFLDSARGWPRSNQDVADQVQDLFNADSTLIQNVVT